jgi:hypothetical protein
MSLLVVHSLLEEQAKVEIEATAVIPNLEDGDHAVPAVLPHVEPTR